MLVVIGSDAAVSPDVPPQAVSEGLSPAVAPAAVSDRVQATPLVRRIAQELGVDLASVTASGARRTHHRAGRARSAATPGEGRREKVRGVRRQIVEHLTRAHREMPAVTYVEECDFGGVDLKLLLPTVLHATALTLRDFPELNARLEGDEIVYLDRYDLGIAVQTDQGLVVPVVRGMRHAERRGASRRTSTRSRRRRGKASSPRTSCAARRSPSPAPASSPACS